jgi:hypothetical protein
LLPLLLIQCMSRRDLSLSVKGGTSERCYRTRRGRTDDQRFAILNPYFDGRIKMNLRIYNFWPNYFSKLSSVWLRRGCLFAWRTDGHNSGVFRRWIEICEWKHEYKVHRLHATWIKPEVVATKKYTGYLHYRFITTGSSFLWSPCCSYMRFFEFLCGPANCLSVYDIVFPMFWTFLWRVNGSVSGPILHML